MTTSMPPSSPLAAMFTKFTGFTIFPGGPSPASAKAFIRAGYQHYRYDYTGSLDWNMRPYDLDSAAERAQAAMLGLQMVDKADQVYVTFEAKF
jgi:hypothetical protein